MRIALIATEKLPVPAIRGGAIQIYLDSVASIISNKHDVTVISITDPSLPTTEQQNGVNYIRFNEEEYVQAIAEHLKQARFDIVHLCNRPKWIETLKVASPETKFILSVHNEMFAYEKISDADGERCIANVAKIITVSDYIGKTITSRFPSALGKTETVYSGVDLNTYQPKWTQNGLQKRNAILSTLNLKGKKVILFVGRLSKVKGPHLLLQALPEIIEKHKDAVLVFIGSKWFGDDGINNYVKHLYTLGAMYKDHVKFIKFVPPKTIPDLYAMTDVFVCSSQWQEPLARVHYEAMAAGIPIVTSNRGGNPEVIDEGKNGHVIFDFENPHSYAEVINTLLDSPSKRQEMGKYGRSKVEKNFGWNNVANNLLQIYENV